MSLAFFTSMHRGSAMVGHTLRRRRMRGTIPISPVPISASELGSGTVEAGTRVKPCPVTATVVPVPPFV